MARLKPPTNQSGKSASAVSMSGRARVSGKLVIVLCLPLLAGVVFHAALGSLVSRGIDERWWLMAVALLAWCAMLALTGLVGAVTRQRFILYVLPLALSLTGWLIGLDWTVFSGMVVEALALFLLILNSQREAKSRVKFSVVKILTFGMTVSLALMLASIALFSYQGFVKGAASGRLQTAVVEGAVASLNKTLPLAFKDYRPTMTVDELILSQVPTPMDLLNEFQNQPPPPERWPEIEQKLRAIGVETDQASWQQIQSLPRAEYQKFIREVSQQIEQAQTEVLKSAHQQVGQAVGVPISGQAAVQDALRQVVNQRLDRLIDAYSHFVAPVLSVSLFLTLAIFIAIYTWLIWGIAAASFWLLHLLGLIERREEQATVATYRIT